MWEELERKLNKLEDLAYIVKNRRMADKIQSGESVTAADIRKKLAGLLQFPGLTREQARAVRARYAPYRVSTIVHREMLGLKGDFDPDYIPQEMYFAYLDPWLNNRKKAVVLENKCLLKRLFPGIPQPETVAYRMNGFWLTPELAPMSLDQALKAAEACGTVFVKRAEDSCGGRGIVRVEAGENYGQRLEKTLADMRGDLLIQKPIRQHRDLARINPGAVNTYRIVTLLEEGGARLVRGVARFGAGGAPVDNFSSGGLICGIDEEGKLTRYAYSHTERRETHPDTGVRFEGCVLPAYAEAVELAKKAHPMLPSSRLIAWDFTVGEDGGPLLVEANLCEGGIDMVQIATGPLFAGEDRAMLDEALRDSDFPRDREKKRKGRCQLTDTIKHLGEKLLNALVFNGMAAAGEIACRQLLRESARADAYSQRLLLRLVRRNRNTEFGKKYHFDEIRSVEDYQRLVPLTDYEDYRAYIDRTGGTGEQGLMTADKINYFAVTSGTVGEMKRIPVVRRAYMPYLRMVCICVRLVRQELKKRGLSCFNGRAMNLVEASGSGGDGPIRQGYISGYVVKNAASFVSAITSSPVELIRDGVEADTRYLHIRYALQDRDLCFMMSAFLSALTDLMAYMTENADMLIRDIETGTINPSVKMSAELRRKLEARLRPDPERARELREIFASPEKGPVVPRIWRRMVLAAGIGTGEFAPYVNKMRAFAGDRVAIYHVFYAASEALIGQAMRVEDDRYMLLPDGGFFEFLPVDGECERPLTVGELEDGGVYELVLTNLAGLYRYRIRDVVRVAGFEGKAPYLQFAYRDQQVVNIAGVHLTAEHITAAVRKIREKLGIRVADYSLYVDDDCAPARIVLFLEPEGELPPEKRAALRRGIDEILGGVNPDFHDLLTEKHISPTLLRLLPPGACREYRYQKMDSGVIINQIKAVRVLRTPEQLAYFMRAADAEECGI